MSRLATTLEREPVIPDDRGSLTQRLLDKIEPDPFGGCWLWAYARLSSNGYGRATVEGRPDSAHRVSWRAFRGDIPQGQSVLHRCDVRACINPAHLFLGTKGENNRDRAAKGRSATRVGDQNTAAKLAASAVQDIRRRISEGETQAALAAEYGVTPSTITDIKKGRSWTHV